MFRANQMKKFSMAASLVALAAMLWSTPGIAAEAQQLTLLFHGSVHGEIEDCGCKSKPLGGIARRAVLMEKIRGENEHVIAVDCGSLFGRASAEEQPQSAFLAEETARLRYDCFGVGSWDFGYGLDYLRATAKQNGFVQTCANLKDSASGELLFAPYQIVERGGLRIGFISVISESFQLEDVNGPISGIEIEEPFEALDRHLAELNQKTDAVVLLANLKNNETRNLLLDLGQESGIDIAIEGHIGRRINRAQRVGNSYVLAANNQGKYLGQCDLSFSADGSLDDLDLKIHEIRIDLPEDRQMAARVKDFVKNKGDLAQKR